MCCLCFGAFTFDKLSKNSQGEFIDVCVTCRNQEDQLKALREAAKVADAECLPYELLF